MADNKIEFKAGVDTGDLDRFSEMLKKLQIDIGGMQKAFEGVGTATSSILKNISDLTNEFSKLNTQSGAFQKAFPHGTVLDAGGRPTTAGAQTPVTPETVQLGDTTKKTEDTVKKLFDVEGAKLLTLIRNPTVLIGEIVKAFPMATGVGMMAQAALIGANISRNVDFAFRQSALAQRSIDITPAAEVMSGQYGLALARATGSGLSYQYEQMGMGMPQERGFALKSLWSGVSTLWGGNFQTPTMLRAQRMEEARELDRQQMKYTNMGVQKMVGWGSLYENEERMFGQGFGMNIVSGLGGTGVSMDEAAPYMRNLAKSGYSESDILANIGIAGFNRRFGVAGDFTNRMYQMGALTGLDRASGLDNITSLFGRAGLVGAETAYQRGDMTQYIADIHKKYGGYGVGVMGVGGAVAGAVSGGINAMQSIYGNIPAATAAGTELGIKGADLAITASKTPMDLRRLAVMGKLGEMGADPATMNYLLNKWTTLDPESRESQLAAERMGLSKDAKGVRQLRATLGGAAQQPVTAMTKLVESIALTGGGSREWAEMVAADQVFGGNTATESRIIKAGFEGFNSGKNTPTQSTGNVDADFATGRTVREQFTSTTGTQNNMLNQQDQTLIMELRTLQNLISDKKGTTLYEAITITAPKAFAEAIRGEIDMIKGQKAKIETKVQSEEATKKFHEWLKDPTK